MSTINYGKAFLMYAKNASGMTDTTTGKAVEGNDANKPNSDGPLSSVTEFFNADTVNVDNTWKVIAWDCVIDEMHHAENEVTKYPIQSGFMVSDHIIRQNRILKLRGVIVNVGLVPQGLDAMIDLAAKAGGAILGTGFGAIVSSAITKAKYLFSEDKVNKVRNTFDELEKLCLTGTFVHATTILGNYMNCIVRSVDVRQDSKTSSILIAELVLEEIQVQYSGAGEAWNNIISGQLTQGSKETFKWKSYATAIGINASVALGGLI